ncbi:MAG: hypothetical protein A3F72_15010 [Bacteroidetes bacterium RIFCSPLOWO2_12_FULL_35_15]|nr:MAG: hypothetical protein A3F72_15010 [Bacteroidetes bacterium RIFCSPLOWO2_12_FULL_35_15]
MKKRFLPVIFYYLFFLFHSLCFSQNAEIDSLLHFLKRAPEDSTKVNTFHTLFLQFEFEDDEKAKEYLKKALELSQKIDYKKGLATTYTYLGFFAEDKGDNRQAVIHYQTSLKISEKIGDKKGVASSYNNIGAIYYAQGNYPEALKFYFAALKIREAINDKIGIAASYNNIGVFYADQNNVSEALKNHYASLKIEKEINDKYGIAASYNNIGIIYKQQGNYQEALNNYFASLKIKKLIGDKTGMAASYNNIGNIYTILGNYSDALKNQIASLKIEEEIGDKEGIALSYSNIGDLYSKQKRYKEAEEYLIKSKKLALEIGHKECLRFVYNTLADLDSAKGDFKRAYKNYKQSIFYRDSLNNEETRGKTLQSQMTYDFEKKEAIATAEHKKELENQEALAEEKSRKQKIVLLFVLVSLVLVVLFAGFIFRSLRVTRKQKHIIELQKNRVEQQKQEVEYQKHLVEAHQKEIIDSITYAKRLQQAILPSDEEIIKYLPDSFLLYQPKDIVAGDFYWMHVVPFEDLKTSNPALQAEVNEKKENNAVPQIIFIAAADSTGHGVPGAMVSVVCSNALNRAVNEFNLFDTGKILDKTRELVLETFAKSGEEIKDGMDISLLSLKFEAESSKLIALQWSGANNPLWYTQQIRSLNENTFESAKQEEVIFHEIKPDKQSIGQTENPQSFTSHNIELKAGTTFYLMTDGYADQFGGSKGKKFMHKQLEQLLKENNYHNLLNQKEILSENFENWKGNLEQVDDVTIIGIRV